MITLSDAKEANLKRYDGGRPCKKHGPGERYVSSAACVQCVADRRIARRATEDRDHRRQLERARYQRPKSVEQWLPRTLQGAKRRAREQSCAFSLTLPYLISIWTATCPIFGVEMTFDNRGKHNPDNQATLDKIDPAKGYIEGNVMFISNLANRIKDKANSTQIRRVADWLLSVEKPAPLPLNQRRD